MTFTQPTFGALVRDVVTHLGRKLFGWLSVRWRFWRLVRRGEAPFWYEEGTGRHGAADSYNLFSDRVRVRWGRFGRVQYYSRMSRDSFVRFGETHPGVTDHNRAAGV